MEIFIIGLLFGAGAAKGKSLTKAVAKGYMAVTEVTKSAATSIRADMRDAIEEARYEREQDDDASAISATDRDAEALALHEETTRASVAPVPAVVAQPVGEVVAAKAVADKPKGSLNLMKSLMKGYVAVAEKTKGAAASLREDVRDAIEEARYEREQAALRTTQTETAAAAVADAEPVVAAVVPTAATNDPIAAAADAPRVKRAYTRRNPVVTAASPAKPIGRPRTANQVKDTSAPTPETAPVRRGRPPKSASQERQVAESSAVDALVEIAELAETVL